MNHLERDPLFPWDQVVWLVNTSIKWTIIELNLTRDCDILVSFLHEEELSHLQEISRWLKLESTIYACRSLQQLQIKLPNYLVRIAGVSINQHDLSEYQQYSRLVFVTVIVNWCNHGVSYHSMHLMICMYNNDKSITKANEARVLLCRRVLVSV